MPGLSFVTTLAYDWKYAFSAIRSYYAIADEIILGLDADRISWSKKPFLFDDRAVAAFIATIDTDKKIRIVEGNFHGRDVPMENETAERRELGAACRRGNWVVQIDADEILLNPLEFKSFLNVADQDACVLGSLVPVYKIFGNKALIVAGRPETVRVATRSPHLYRFARITDQPSLLSQLLVLHLAWCRTEEELLQKMMHWSHSQEIDVDKTMSVWRATDLDNYLQLRDFHPLHGPLWQFLQIIDWPPKPLDPGIFEQLETREPTRNLSDNRIIVEGKSARGAVMISFGRP